MKNIYDKKFDEKAISYIKSLGISMINEANSGHPGIVLGAAPILYTLYTRHLNYDLSNPNWIGRDRFVMSAGHGSALLYSTLFMLGFDYNIDDLKMFRKIGSNTPGHVELSVERGIEATTGPLGQGFGMGVGMALASTYLNSMFPQVFNNFTYVLVSDGDLMEGISYEAASFAGTNKLNKLIVLYDSNNVSLDGELNKSFNENVRDRFDSMNWNTIFVKNGDSIKEIDNAIKIAKKSNKPTLIEIKTVIGKGSKYEGTSRVHGKPLSTEDVIRVKEKLGVEIEPFVYDNDVREYSINVFKRRNLEKIYKWNEQFDKYKTNSFIEKYISGEMNFDIRNFEEKIKDKDLSGRELNGAVMNLISESTNFFIGGSADLASSNKTCLKMYKNYSSFQREGRNIWFGVREHVMGAIVNGLALMGLRSYGSTFLVFSDYMKPAIRLSALMNLPVTYIFTHDSVNIGQDGPTHQPVEQLIGLRSIPNLDVYRPADINEILGTWNVIIKEKRPSVIVLSRNKTPFINGAIEDVINGAYIISKENDKLDGILLVSGSEVELALNIKRELNYSNLRIVSIPSINRFLRMDKKYREEIIPKGVKVVPIEPSSLYNYSLFVNDISDTISIDSFGYSGKGENVLKKIGFDYDTILNKVRKAFNLDKKE